MKKNECEKFEHWQDKYIEMFGEENLFTTIFMSHDEILGIFKKAVKENKPYKEARPVSERLELMKSRIAKSGDVVISGSLSGWGDGLIPLFTLAVRLVTDCDIRLNRLKKREKEKFGARVETGGDMFDEHKAFLAWAAEYDSGDRTIRSKALHDEWQKLLPCPLIVLDGSAPAEENFEKIRTALKR